MTAKELRANKGCIYHFEAYKNAHTVLSRVTSFLFYFVGSIN